MQRPQEFRQTRISDGEKLIRLRSSSDGFRSTFVLSTVNNRYNEVMQDEDQKNVIGARDMMLTSPPGVPFPFSVIVRNTLPDHNSGLSIEVKGNPVSGLSKSWRYYLVYRDHAAYLDLLEKLSKDFGLRLPQNRHPFTKPIFRAKYREVLSRNLTPGMYYGYGDPALLRVEEYIEGEGPWYYLLVTSNDAPDSFPIIRSKNLEDWEFVDFVFPRYRKPEWAADGEGVSDYWAPELHKIGSEFRVYFVARDKVSLELCIGTARSLRPYGPFVPDTSPILTGNVIDPHIFVDENDTAYLFWKEDNNEVWPRCFIDLLYEYPYLITQLFTAEEDRITASFIVTLWPWARMLKPMERFQVIQIFIEAVIFRYQDFYDHLTSLINSQSTGLQEGIRSVLHHMKTPVFAQKLSADGLTLLGQRTKVIENDLAWEAHLVEGMWVAKYGNKCYLFYAGNDFSTSEYGIGVAIADSPLGPYQKMKQQLLQSTEEWWAPGHPSLVIGTNGKPQLFLHAYFPKKTGYKQFRALLAITVTFKENTVLLDPADKTVH